MNLLLSQKEIERGVKCFMSERSDVLTIHVEVKEFIYGDNVVNVLVGTLHHDDYILSEEEIMEGVLMYLEECHCFNTEKSKVLLLPNFDLDMLEAVVNVKAAEVGEGF